MAYFKEILCNKKRVKININSEADESVFGEVFVEREYKILEPVLLKDVDPVLDIGAHVGMFSIYARCFNPKVQIFAFEPEEGNFAAMKENLRANGIGGVMMKNVAVAGEIGVRELHISADSHNHSLLKVGDGEGGDNSELAHAEEGFSSGGITKKVNTTTLSQIFLKNNLERVSLVKMDCEGAEFEILRSASLEILQKVGAFYIEYHKYENNDPKVLRQILEKAGFKVDMKESFYDRRFGFVWARR